MNDLIKQKEVHPWKKKKLLEKVGKKGEKDFTIQLKKEQKTPFPFTDINKKLCLCETAEMSTFPMCDNSVSGLKSFSGYSQQFYGALQTLQVLGISDTFPNGVEIFQFMIQLILTLGSADSDVQDIV